MQKYDLTVLVKDISGWEEKIEKLVKVLGGKVGRMTEMGKKQLAYPIAKQTESHFLSWTVELGGDAVVQLGKKLSVDREVLRHLLVKASK